MRLSQYFLPTSKETPSDAELISHQLMIRAGLIRKLASGLYTWLPLGFRVLKKVEHIVREELNKCGAQECLLPSIQPAELWQETGRWDKYGRELLKLSDRHEREFCYSPTAEEVITDITRAELRSYKQLPVTLYQISLKFRDEIRPRFGVMRSREFLMMDAYSFHIDQNSLIQTYHDLYQAYNTIFTRLGLKFRAVEADNGSIGGNASHEFHVLAEAGEDLLAYCPNSDYAANLEKAEAIPPTGERAKPGAEMTIVDTPNQRSINEVSQFLKLDPKQTVKILLVRGSEADIVGLILRGDHQLNEIKAEKHPAVASPLEWVSEQEIEALSGAKPGSVGPVGLSIPIIADHSAAHLADFCCGANQNDKHYLNVNWGRDLPEPQYADLRNVEPGDASPDGKGTLELLRGIEVGHIFQLGTSYSESMHATVLDENGKSIPLAMGCYGIGISRIVAAAIEQNHDEDGIIWPDNMAPFKVAIVPINYHRSSRVKETADKLYQQLSDQGIDVLIDDRQERPGAMFATMDLIGIPHRIVIGEKGLDKGTIEYKARAASESEDISIDAVLDKLV